MLWGSVERENRMFLLPHHQSRFARIFDEYHVCRGLFLLFQGRKNTNFIVFCFGKKEEDIDLTVTNKYYYVQGQDIWILLYVIQNTKTKSSKKLENHNIGISNVYYNFMDVRQAIL